MTDNLAEQHHLAEDQPDKEAEELTKQIRLLPPVKTDDPNFIRIRYLRYVDDWIVGVIGPREIAESFKADVKETCRDVLKIQPHLKSLPFFRGVIHKCT